MTQRAVPWTGVWREVWRFQRDSIRPWIGIRNAIGVALPLAIGAATGHVPSGLVAATGALNVAFTDSHVPYPQRARRMMAASVVVGIGVIAGALCASNHLLVVGAAAAWAFAAGMLVALDQTAADLGTISLVTLVVFAALPMPLEDALLSGGLAFCGGLAQTAMSVLLWPLRRYVLQRRALAEFFHGLAEVATRPVTAMEPPAASAQSTQAQEWLSALDRDYSLDAERYRALLGQGERMRLSLLALLRMRVRLERDGAAAEVLESLLRFVALTADLLRQTGDELLDGHRRNREPLLDELQSIAEAIRARPAELGRQGVRLLDAITGQLRAVSDLLERASGAVETRTPAADARRPRRLRVQSAAAILRANLSLQSAACRHAIRLCICVAGPRRWGSGWR